MPEQSNQIADLIDLKVSGAGNFTPALEKEPEELEGQIDKANSDGNPELKTQGPALL